MFINFNYIFGHLINVKDSFFILLIEQKNIEDYIINQIEE